MFYLHRYNYGIIYALSSLAIAPSWANCSEVTEWRGDRPLPVTAALASTAVLCGGNQRRTQMISLLKATPRVLAKPMRILDGWANRLAAYLERRHAIKTLSQLDDRELRDIGLSRWRIESAVSGFARSEGELGRVR
jgi:uncharacterized protein YjiS (DUF1127 family)